MPDDRHKGIAFAALAAVFYALNAPLSKLLLKTVSPTMLAALLYLGAGIGMSALYLFREKTGGHAGEKKLSAKELPYTIMMVLLDIAAPIALMYGLLNTTAANAALLNNFEIAATSLIALLFFREVISRRLWLGLGLVTLASMMLSIQDMGSFAFSVGSMYVLVACLCWGLENNCTRMMSSKNPMQIVVIKGLFSGAGALAISLALGDSPPAPGVDFQCLCMGFITYGLSIYLYIHAQRVLGAAKTSAYYAIAPFIGAALSFLIFLEMPTLQFLAALAVMALGTWFVSKDARSA